MVELLHLNIPPYDYKKKREVKKKKMAENEKKGRIVGMSEEDYINTVVKKGVILRLKTEAEGLSIDNLKLDLETKEFKMEGTTTNFEKGEISYQGRASFALLVDGKQIVDQIEMSFNENSIEIVPKTELYLNARDYITSIIENFAELKSLWYKCDVCGKLIEIVIEWQPRSYVYSRKLSVISGEKLDCDFNAVYQKLKEIAWSKRDEIAKENFRAVVIDDFEKLKEFRESAEKIIGSIENPSGIKRPTGRGFFGKYDICSKCQKKIKPEMTLEEIAKLLPDFCELNKEHWEDIKEVPVKCELKPEL